MNKQRKHYTPQENVAIPRRHVLEKYGRERQDYTFVIVGAEAGMLRMTRVPFPGSLSISTLPP